MIQCSADMSCLPNNYNGLEIIHTVYRLVSKCTSSLPRPLKFIQMDLELLLIQLEQQYCVVCFDGIDG